MPKLYLIEDDPSLRAECARLLELDGYEVVFCEDFSAAADEALALDIDGVVLDLTLPGADGLAVCRKIRSRSAVPIVVLTSSDSEFDEVMSMNLGADDYVTKPYAPAVLLARIAAALRRGGAGSAAPVLAYNGARLDPSRGELRFGDRTIELTRNEQRIMEALIRADGAIVSRSTLMYELWQSDSFIDDNTLTVNVNRLRKSLAAVGAPAGFLKTHRGQGYSL